MRAMTRQKRVPVTSTWPGRSMRQEFGLRDSARSGTLRASARSPTGRFTKKIAGQLAIPISQPPASGPMARPKPETPAQMPMACARSRGSGKAAASTERLPGASAAAPTPCTTRPKRSQPSVGANPQNVEPIRNSTSPSRKKRLRPKRSPSVPPVSIRAAKDRGRQVRVEMALDRWQGRDDNGRIQEHHKRS